MLSYCRTITKIGSCSSFSICLMRYKLPKQDISNFFRSIDTVTFQSSYRLELEMYYMRFVEPVARDFDEFADW